MIPNPEMRAKLKEIAVANQSSEYDDADYDLSAYEALKDYFLNTLLVPVEKEVEIIPELMERAMTCKS